MITILFLLAFNSTLFITGKVTPELARVLDQNPASAKISVIVHMGEQYPDLSTTNKPVSERARILKQIAATSQAPLITYLSQCDDKVSDIKRFWIFNGFHMKATARVIEELAGRDDVWFISPDAAIQLPADEKTSGSGAVEAIEWNILKVMADSCWVAGFTGDSVLIGHLDTGVDFTHPALAGKFSGWWRDFINGLPDPYDDQGHGTYVAGVLCGGDGLGPFTDDIGVAPGAQLVVAKIFDAGGGGSYEDIDSGMQWLADLKADSGVNIRAVTNSWGTMTATELHWWTFCAAWKSLEMLPVFAVGGYGPGAGTAGVPANYPLCLGVGSTDNSDNIASFSSRGPAPDMDPWNDMLNWYRPDWNLIKPDISAPGINIRTCGPGGGYLVLSGTSFSTPHVAGAAAILCEVNPAISITHLYNCLLDNADHPSQGAPYPNNNYGWGRLNVWNAFQAINSIQEKPAAVADTRGTVLVYPSPARSELFIKAPATSRITGIYSAGGFLIKDIRTRRDRIRLDGLPAGIYFLKFENEQDRAVFKKITVIK
ncbi:MAG TPA: S8 family peptidase [bacterium]